MPSIELDSSRTWLPTLSASTELASKQFQFHRERSLVLAATTSAFNLHVAHMEVA